MNTFHLGLSHPCSYHHIPYVFYIEVQCALRIPLTWLVVDPSYITTWHALIHGKGLGNITRSSNMAPNLISPPSAQLCCTWTLVHVEEYARIVHALAPNIHATPSFETIVALRHLHPLAKVDLPPFVHNFHPKTDLVLDRKAFIYTLTHSPPLSFGCPSSMVYELLENCFVFSDSVSGFDFFLRCANTLLVVMFFHQYHAYLLHRDFWFWRNKLKALDPSQFEKWCPTTKLLTSYYISITKYNVMLYQVWCLYHSYVRKIIRVKILWHHSGPFSLLSGHSSYFFRGARPFFSCLTCYPCLFRMLGFDHSCTSISFPTWWSSYFS
jgi:hypothetical protein